MITLSNRDWLAIKESLQLEWAHKPSVFLMRSVMKRELGFTVRVDEIWCKLNYKMSYTIYLDFFNEPAETMFRLRYL